jgi:hypothetical protein
VLLESLYHELAAPFISANLYDVVALEERAEFPNNFLGTEGRPPFPERLQHRTVGIGISNGAGHTARFRAPRGVDERGWGLESWR